MMSDGKDRGTQVTDDHLKRDLAIMRAMAADLGDYLNSSSTHWTMATGRGDMPPLTIGGYLMRRRRLAALGRLLQAGESEALVSANHMFDSQAKDWLVQFESKMLAEMGDRMREWSIYLRDLAASTRLAADTARYAYLADTRVVLEELVDTLQRSPYRLPVHIPADIAALDSRLRLHWAEGEFVWSSVWLPAYPQDRFWWLYGHPAAGVPPTNA